MRDVIIIGGGISGLATAHDLAARGVDVSVLERQKHVGGNAISERVDGFLMEHGPATLNAAFSPAMGHIRGLGLDQSAVDLGVGVRKRYLHDAGRLHGISTHPLGFFTSPYLSVGAKLSLASEFLRPRRSETTDETIHAFAARRFGAEFADKVIEPMAAGIFMGASRDLSIGGAFPKLVELEARFGSILRAVMAAKRGSDPGRRLFSWPGGIAILPRTLAARLGDRVATGVAVTGLTRDRTGFAITTAGHGTLHARAVVLAVQPHVAASLTEHLDPTGTDALTAIAAPAVRVVFLGYRAAQVAHPLDGLGFLSTLNPDHLISGAQFSSTMFAGRASKGHVAISCYVGGTRNPDVAHMDEADVVNIVQKELADLLGISGPPVHLRTRLWPRGLPQYTLGHGARKKIVGSTPDRVSGLYLAGNYLNGVSVTSCLEQAGKTAEAVATKYGGALAAARGVGKTRYTSSSSTNRAFS
jgi:protoporphyrinogen/coproporphyrinogen III oxidase